MNILQVTIAGGVGHQQVKKLAYDLCKAVPLLPSDYSLLVDGIKVCCHYHTLACISSPVTAVRRPTDYSNCLRYQTIICSYCCVLWMPMFGADNHRIHSSAQHHPAAIAVDDNSILLPSLFAAVIYVVPRMTSVVEFQKTRCWHCVIYHTCQRSI